MKKTLIMAVLASAFAASSFAAESKTLADATSVTDFSSGYDATYDLWKTDPVITGSTKVDGKGTFTLVAVFDWSDLLSAAGDCTTVSKVVGLHQNSVAGYNGIRALGLHTDGTVVDGEKQILVSAMRYQDGWTNTTSTTAINGYASQDRVVLTLVASATAGLDVYIYDAKTAKLVNLVDTDNTTSWDFEYLIAASNFRGSMEAVYVFGEALTDDNGVNNLTNVSSAAYNAAIPEPATATLSLLALAGLAARRRRK